MISHAKVMPAGSASGRSAWRATLLVSLSLALAALAAFTAGSAFAAETHPYTGISFGPTGTPTSGFKEVAGVAVDPGSGNVYVFDRGAKAIYKFDAEGQPLDFSGLASGKPIEGVVGSCCSSPENELAVAPPGSPAGTAGDIYLANGISIIVFAPSGAKLSEIPMEEICGVATDPAGHVFIGFYPSKVREYVPSQNPFDPEKDEKAASNTALPAEICNVAADGLGNVYAASYNGEQDAVRLEGIGASTSTSLESSKHFGNTLAVDPATNDLYVNRRDAILQYGSSDASPITVFGAEQLAGATGNGIGVAVNGTSGDVYAAASLNFSESYVYVFGPLALHATIKAQAASEILPDQVTLNGTVDPEGLAVSECFFEYGTTVAFGQTAPCEGTIPIDSSTHAVTAKLTGLQPETKYHFRLAVTDANGTNRSGELIATSANAAVTGEVDPIGGTNATAHGTVFPGGEVVSKCFFEYARQGSSQVHEAPCEESIPADEGEHEVSAVLTHLVPGSIYQYKLVIERPSGTVEGKSAQFFAAKTVLTGSAGAGSATTATINGSVAPEGVPLTECLFEYGVKAKVEDPYTSSVPCAESPGEIGSGFDPVSVHADLSGLTAGATYHYRLVATSEDGTASGVDRRFGGPLIEAEHVNGVTETKATLMPVIDPNSLPTTYHLEYGTTASYETSTAEEGIGAGEGPQAPATTLEGLKPGVTYHWRAIATNAHGTTTGPDRTFIPFEAMTAEADCANQALRGGASASLPDCRAYEMVSPAQKSGEVMPPEPNGNLGGSCSQCLPGGNDKQMPMQSSPNGDAVAYEGQPFGEAMAAGPNEYLARRTGSGWQSQSLSPPLFVRATPSEQGYKEFSADLTRSLVFQVNPVLSSEAPSQGGVGFANLYLRDESGALQPLITSPPPHRGPGVQTNAGEELVIALSAANSGTTSSPALSHIVFEANDTLTGPTADAPAPTDGGRGGGTFGLNETKPNIYEWIDGQLRLVNVLPGNAVSEPGAVVGAGYLNAVTDQSREGPDVEHAISDDGSRIFWSDRETGQLYLRIEGKETVEIKDHAGHFLTASADGSKVLLSDGCLYDVQAEACQGGLPGGLSGFRGTLGAAEDLSRVYFVDTEALTPEGEENANGEHAEAGELNLYAWDEGDVAFIATLEKQDNVGTAGAWRPARRTRTAQVSADGRYLAFMSVAPVTGHDNIQAPGETSCDFNNPPTSGHPCSEVFEYDAVSSQLNCVSCNPSNGQPLGESNLSLIATKTFSAVRQPTNLSAEGHGRIFFESQDALTPADRNGSIQDVYEWEPSGVGGCKREAGCVSLISSGQSPNDSIFLDSSASGDDAFLITRQQLLPRDKDELLDLYDARVNGGFDENAPPPCQAEACKGQGTAAGEQPGAGSSTFTGPGNEKPKKQKHKKRHKHAHKHKSHKRAAKHGKGGQK